MTFFRPGEVQTLRGGAKRSQGKCKMISKKVRTSPYLPSKSGQAFYSHMLPLQDNLACLNLPKRAHACSNPLMYGSILPVTIRPGNPHGFADFLFPKCQFPTPGQIKNANFPPQGKRSQTITAWTQTHYKSKFYKINVNLRIHLQDAFFLPLAM